MSNVSFLSNELSNLLLASASSTQIELTRAGGIVIVIVGVGVIIHRWWKNR